MRKIISLICLLLPIAVHADELKLQDNAPSRYIVVKGDTLWDISAKFFKDPWKWPQIWGYNKDSIKDPHWIYPGDVVYLDPGTHTLKVDEGGATNASVPAMSDSGVSSATDVVKLEPRVRVVHGSGSAIDVVSLKYIAPFLARPLVVDDAELNNAPQVVGTTENHELLGTGDIAYVKDLPNNKGERWQIYRYGRTFTDPDTGEVLGDEVVYLGDAFVDKFDTISTLRITYSVLEIGKGDRLAQATTGFSSNYIPHAPDKQINAKIISIYGGVGQGGQYSVVTLNKGSRDGIENGNVLSLYAQGDLVPSNQLFKHDIQLPDQEYGLIFVFRVFDKVSYALVMNSKLPVKILDRASTPE